MNKQNNYTQHTSNQSDATRSQSTDKGMAKQQRPRAQSIWQGEATRCVR